MVSAKTTERRTETNDQQDPMLMRTNLVKANFASPPPYCAISNLTQLLERNGQELNAVLLTDFFTVCNNICLHHHTSMVLYPRQNSRFAFDVQVYNLTLSFTMRRLSFIFNSCLRCDIGFSQ